MGRINSGFPSLPLDSRVCIGVCEISNHGRFGSAYCRFVPFNILSTIDQRDETETNIVYLSHDLGNDSYIDSICDGR